MKRLLLPGFLVGSMVLFFLFGSTEIEGEGQRISESAAPKKGKIKIGQTFFSHYDNLNRIDVMFSSFGKDQHKVTFNLKEFERPLELCEPTQQKINAGLLIVQMNTTIPRINSKEYKSFRFSPIRHSKGKFYYFFIEFQDNMLAPWTVGSDLYPPGSKVVNHSPVKGDLVFRVLYKTKVAKAFHLLLERISKDKPGRFSNLFLYVIVFLLYLFFFMLVLWQLTARDKELE